MKRFLAIIMCLLMVMQVPMVSFAADDGDASVTTGDNTTENPTATEPIIPSVNEEEEEGPLNNEYVNFELQLVMDLPITEKGINLLKDAPIISLQAQSEAITEDPDTTNHYHAIFSEIKDKTIIYQIQNVPAGKYTLKMTSEYFFADHEQVVTIKDGIKTTLVFSDSYNSDRGAGKTSPGVFAIGDANDDGKIDEDDSKIILENIGIKLDPQDFDEEGNPTKVNVDYKSIYDLNQDESIDIGDLSVLAYNMNKTKRDATAIETVLTTAVKISNEQTGVVVESERKLDTIMEDADEPIVVAPADPEAEISEDNPIAIEMDFEVPTEVGAMVIAAPAETGPSKGTITIETFDPLDPDQTTKNIEAEIVDEKDTVKTQSVLRAKSIFRKADAAGTEVEKAQAIRKADGSIVIDLGKQVAIKKVTIVVTATATSTNLAEIAKVEFLNNMESRIPEPELNIPEDIHVEGVGDSFTVEWSEQVNVTGYEVSIRAEKKDSSGKVVTKVYESRTYKAGVNQIKIETFKGGTKDKVTPLLHYYVKVRSINGSWSSPYSEEVWHYQLAGKAPDAPDNVSINGKYRQLDVSWKDMTGTEKYTVEYREKGTTDEYTSIHDIETNSYKITGLKDATTYEVRVYGWNTDKNGNPQRGGYSLPAIGKTTIEIPQYSKYYMIDNSDIASIEARGPVNPDQYPAGVTFNPNYMIDDDYTTYFHSKSWADIGATVTFKQEETVKELVVTSRLEDGYYDDPGGIYTIYITAVDKNNNTKSVSCTVQRLHPTAKNTTRYILNEPVKAVTLNFGLHMYYNAACSISEIRYFRYDSLEDDVNALYADEMHVTLKDDVTLADIEDLEKRANTKDERWDEYHPKKDLLLSELDYAKDLLENKSKIGDVVNVKPEVTKGELGNINFSGGLSGYQPLGYVAQAGSTINVYVGQKGKKVGDSVPVRLVCTQYHAESSAWQSGEITLHQGKNEITVPKISSLDYEKGGSLYIVHTNRANIESYPVEVRVSGATQIPMLDLHRKIGNDRLTVNESEWKATIKTYVEKLKAYAENLPESHAAESHAVYEESVKYAYSKENCFLNYTEISLDNIFMSVPATEILKGINTGDGSVETLTNNMYDTVVAMNQMIELFYKERGFIPTWRNGNRGIPTARFNIRYQRMFAGAFMYAGGLHTGIEFGSVSGLATGKPVVTDENGKYISGNMFGWGIAHELGHNADVSGLTYAEVTNNIWSQFEKAATGNGSRIPYEAVYKHVTSNTVGKPSNVFADLGMYWQLHLAYDTHYAGYNYYKDVFSMDDYEEMYRNEFFARYYSINRMTSLAPETAIKIKGGTTDQNIMRTACAAANKDLTDFFRAWGLEVDATTAEYAAQFKKEPRKIQYINDEAYEYKLNNGAPMADTTKLEVKLEQGKGTEARKVKLTMKLSDYGDMNSILGFEIIRNGKPVAFVQSTGEAEVVYTDVIATLNNRVMEYSVNVYDKYLNVKEGNSLPMIKVRHEGEIPADNWTIKTNTTSTKGTLTVVEGTNVEVGEVYVDAATGEEVEYDAKMDINYLDENTRELVSTYSAANLILDGNYSTSYEGSVKSGLAEIVIDLGGKLDITGMKILGTNTKNWSFGLQYSDNGGASYKALSSFSFETDVDEHGSRRLYFASGAGNKNVNAIKATHFKITSSKNTLPLQLGIAEIALYSPTGDNVDIGISTIENGVETWNTNDAIGLLAEDFILDESTGANIPAGSFIVTGQYTGNAAYNVVKLYNQNHVMFDDSVDNKLKSIISGYQTIFAAVPDEGTIVNVKDGTWIYYLEPLHGDNEGKFGVPGAGEDGNDLVVDIPEKVYAELYRVDDATTLAGERLVSDSFVIDVPQNLKTITLK